VASFQDINTVIKKQFKLSNSVRTYTAKFYAISVVKLRFFKINLKLGGGRSKSSRGGREQLAIAGVEE
jgi:hypothetical protein